MLNRLISTAIAVVIGVLAVSGQASAQAYPDKPVRIVVPYAAGGLADVLTRGIANELGHVWNQPVLVENRTGANTIVAAQHVASAKPDGYTILLANTSTLSSNQYLYSKLPYDPVKDFTPVVNIADTALILVASESFPPNSVRELIDYAKRNPGKVNYGSFGLGSNPHLDTLAFARGAGISLTHVPYKGGVTDVLSALMGGQIDIGLVGISSTLPMIKANKLKALALFAPRRSPLFPDLPTLVEAGGPEVDSVSWFGFVAPRGTPGPIVRKIADDTAKVINRPDFKEKFMTSVGLGLVGQGPAQYAEFLKKDRREYAEKVRHSGVKLN